MDANAFVLLEAGAALVASGVVGIKTVAVVRQAVWAKAQAEINRLWAEAPPMKVVGSRFHEGGPVTTALYSVEIDQGDRPCQS